MSMFVWLRSVSSTSAPNTRAASHCCCQRIGSGGRSFCFTRICSSHCQSIHQQSDPRSLRMTRSTHGGTM